MPFQIAVCLGPPTPAGDRHRVPRDHRGLREQLAPGAAPAICDQFGRWDLDHRQRRRDPPHRRRRDRPSRGHHRQGPHHQIIGRQTAGHDLRADRLIATGTARSSRRRYSSCPSSTRQTIPRSRAQHLSLGRQLAHLCAERADAPPTNIRDASAGHRNGPNDKARSRADGAGSQRRPASPSSSRSCFAVIRSAVPKPSVKRS